MRCAAPSGSRDLLRKRLVPYEPTTHQSRFSSQRHNPKAQVTLRPPESLPRLGQAGIAALKRPRPPTKSRRATILPRRNKRRLMDAWRGALEIHSSVTDSQSANRVRLRRQPAEEL